MVPSSLHQKVKFIIGDEVITLVVDQDVLTTAGQRVLQVHNLQEPKSYTSYQFKMVCTKGEAEEQKKKFEILPPKFRMMVNMKFNPDKGLGKYLQGRRELVKAVRKHSRTTLRFKPELKHRDEKQKRVSFQIPTKTSIAPENKKISILKKTNTWFPYGQHQMRAQKIPMKKFPCLSLPLRT